MQGVLIAGGLGTRLYPITRCINKHLLPISDKPMLYYPISTLMLSGVQDLVIVSTAKAILQMQDLLGDGRAYGMRFRYVAQAEPKGIVDALSVAAPLLDDAPLQVILGDNFFWGSIHDIRQAVKNSTGATILGCPVEEPRPYGVVELDEQGGIVSLAEKPAEPRSKLAIPGFYVYDATWLNRVRSLLEKSPEASITELNQSYLDDAALACVVLGRNSIWFDAGTPENLLAASRFVHAVEQRQGHKIACLEEVALQMKFCTTEAIKHGLESCPAGDYRTYVEQTLARFENAPERVAKHTPKHTPERGAPK